MENEKVMLEATRVIKRKELPTSFTVKMPEIYQIEVSSACNFDCIMCPRKCGIRRDTEPFIDVSLIDSLIRGGALHGSYFIELQMTGEPTLHPDLGRIIQLLHSAGVKVGLSTNGSLMHTCMNDLLHLDYITISVDSLSNYDKIRVGGSLGQLILNISDFARLNKKTAIDLQVVELRGWEKEFEAIKKLFPNLYIRSIPDCFLTLRHPVDFLPVNYERCFNPWMSVSIQSNGNVVPCCFSFWDDIIYGNIKENSLKEIWEGEVVQRLRVAHEQQAYPNICARCYMRSPVLLHWELFCNSIKKKVQV